MATAIQILGNPGSGKTFSLSNLNPEQTYLINCDKKPLTFRGGKRAYSAEKKNYTVTSSIETIRNLIIGVSTKAPHIKTIVIDTVSSVMSDKEMSDFKKKSYDKWVDYAQEIYDLYRLAGDPSLRDDLFIIFIGHTEHFNDNGLTRQRLKTGGSKLTKLNLEGVLSYTLYTEVEMDGDKPSYHFITQTDGTTTARSPEGCLDFRMPNDLNLVMQKILEYENSEM